MKPQDYTERIFYDGLASIEVSPSPDVWAKMESNLPDASSILFAQKFDGFSPPPPNIWEKLNGMLEEATDENENKFDAFLALATNEVTPPPMVWTNIEGALPEQEDLVFKTLETFIAPAANRNWEEIENQLEENTWAENFTALGSITPPTPEIWDRIVSRMESIEDVSYESHFGQLQDLEENPTESSWHIIEAHLENQSQQENFDAFFAPLAQYQSAPSAAIWNRIEQRLEVGDDKIFAQLRNAERTPPPRVWEKIERDLPFNPFLSYHLKNFARVAAVLLVGWSLTLLYQHWDTTSTNPLADNDKSSTKKTAIDTKGIKTTDPKLRRPNLDISNEGQNQEDLIAKAADFGTEERINTSNSYSDKNNIKNSAKYSGRDENLQKKSNKGDFNVNKPQNSVAANNTVKESGSFVPPSTGNPPVEKDFLIPLEPRSFSVLALTNGLEHNLDNLIPTNISQDIDEKYKNQFQTLNPNGSNPILSSPSVDMNMETDPIESIKTGYRGWVASGFFGANATQLYQTDLRNQLASSGEIRKNLKIAQNFGVGIGYQFTSKTTLFAEYRFAQQGQNYIRTQAGSTENIGVNTSYHYIALPVRYRIANAYVNTPIAVSLIAGPQFGWLNNYSVLPSDNVISPSLLIQQELGVTGGIDFELYTEKMKNCYLSVGVRGAYGRDVHKILQSDATQQSSVGLRLGLHYRLGNKNK